MDTDSSEVKALGGWGWGRELEGINGGKRGTPEILLTIKIFFKNNIICITDL